MQQPQIHRNLVLRGSDQKPILLDLFLPSKAKAPLLVYAHGFKGFKDWGHAEYMARFFMDYGIAFAKFNFSHNGVTQDDPSDISDPETFGLNNYSKEQYDLGVVLDFLEQCEWKDRMAFHTLGVVGHSRGGAMAFIKALSEKRIKKLILWAAPFDLKDSIRTHSVAQWNNKGVVQVKNKRTGQQYPLYKQFYDDFIKNEKKFDIPAKALELNIPLLIMHSSDDLVVPVQNAKQYYEAIPHSVFIDMEHGGHTFGATHPFDPATNPHIELINTVLENTAEFLTDENTMPLIDLIGSNNPL